MCNSALPKTHLWRAVALAAGLAELGLRAGDRVVLWMKNCPQFIEAMFACWKAGFVVVPMNARLTPAEIAFQATDCTASALVYGADFASGAAWRKTSMSARAVAS